MLEPGALRLMAKWSFDAPAYHREKVDAALHMDGRDAPIPALNTEEMCTAVFLVEDSTATLARASNGN